MSPPPQRSKLYSIGAVSLAVGVALFLLLAPAVEREAYLSQLQDGDESQWEGAVRHLCWISPGREGMNGLLLELERERRVGILNEAHEQGCLSKLAPALQADFRVWRFDEPRARHEAISLGPDVVEAAVGALDADEPAVREHAAEILFAVDANLSDEQRARVEEAIDTLPETRLAARGKSKGAGRREAGEAVLEAASKAASEAASNEADATTIVDDAIDEFDLQLRPPSLRVEDRGSVLFVGDDDDAGSVEESDETSEDAP